MVHRDIVSIVQRLYVLGGIGAEVMHPLETQCPFKINHRVLCAEVLDTVSFVQRLCILRNTVSFVQRIY